MIYHIRVRTAHWFHDVQRAVVTPSGFRLAVSLTALSVVVSLASFCLLHGIPTLTADTWRTALVYASEYWRQHWIILLIVLGAYSIVCSTIVARIVLSAIAAPIEIKLSDFNRDTRLNRFTTVLSVLTPILAVATLPFLTLLAPNWVAQACLGGITLVSSVLSIAFSMPTTMRRPVERSLSHLTFPRGASFDVASIGSACQEASEAKIDFTRRRQSGMASSAAFNADAFIQGLSQFVGVPKESLTLHEKTTAAIRAALTHCYTDRAVCVYSDLEYDSVRAVIQGMFRDRAKMAECNTEAWRGVLSGTDIANRVAEIAETAPPEYDPVIICISHVCFETGLCVDIPRLIERTKGNTRIRLIVDGAQAIGNIVPEKQIFAGCHFYAFSGHKWLLGEPTLGGLYANAVLLGRAQGQLAEDLVQARPFSYWRQSDNGDKETVNLDAYVTLNATLADLNDVGASRIEDHNTKLATACRRWLERLAIVDIPRIQQRGGIVPLLIPRADAFAQRLLDETGFVTRAVHDNRALRVSIHYTVGEADVHELCYEIARLLMTHPES